MSGGCGPFIDGVGNTSVWSAVWTFIVKTQPQVVINAPANVVASVTGNTVTLTWQDNSSNEDGFTIERGTKTAGTIKFTQVGQVGANVTRYAETVSAGTLVSRVQALNRSLNIASGYSNEVTVRVKGR